MKNIFSTPGVLSALAKNIRVELLGKVLNNMVYMLSHISIIASKLCLFLDKTKAVLHQFPQTRLKNCVTTAVVTVATEVRHTRAQVKFACAREKKE